MSETTYDPTARQTTATATDDDLITITVDRLTASDLWGRSYDGFRSKAHCPEALREGKARKTFREAVTVCREALDACEDGTVIIMFTRAQATAMRDYLAYRKTIFMILFSDAVLEVPTNRLYLFHPIPERDDR